MNKSQPQGYQLSAFRTLYDKAAEFVDRKIGWYRLPVPLGLAVLGGLRDVLRSRNLYDTSALPAVNLPPVAPATPEVRTNRTLDGTYNDLSQPRMGMAGSRFGRNVPLEYAEPEPLPRMMQPSPREVSRALFTRDKLIPATSVNALVAAWLQFMIRDWFSHGKGPKQNPWEIPLTDDDPWPVRPMQVMRTRTDPTAPPGGNHPPTHTNTQTPWWDASQIYGTTPEQQQLIRTGQDGKLNVGPDGLPPMPDDPAIDPRHRARLLARAAHDADAVHPGTQLDLRPAPRRVPAMVRRRDLPAGAADQRGADRQDPHGGVDARRHQPSHDEDRHAGELVGPCRRTGEPGVRPDQQERGHQRHPRLGAAAVRRAVLAHRGVRGGVPDAPARARRLRRCGRARTTGISCRRRCATWPAPARSPWRRRSAWRT